MTEGGDDFLISEQVIFASTYWERLLGVHAIGGLKDGQCLLLKPCNGIHTFGLREPIDVVVLDNRGRVLRIMYAVRPNRVQIPKLGGHSTLELKCGMIEVNEIRVGDSLRFEQVS